MMATAVYLQQQQRCQDRNTAVIPGRLTSERRTTARERPTAAQDTNRTSVDANSIDARTIENTVKQKGC
jgi:hypothetical protein